MLLKLFYFTPVNRSVELYSNMFTETKDFTPLLYLTNAVTCHKTLKCITLTIFRSLCHGKIVLRTQI